jgi:hypothetical protein
MVIWISSDPVVKFGIAPRRILDNDRSIWLGRATAQLFEMG